MSHQTDKDFDSLRRKVFLGTAAVTSQLILPATAIAGSKKPVSTGGDKMDVDRFIDDCVSANNEVDAQAAVLEVLARAVSEPGKVIAALGDPDKAGLDVLLSSESLTIFSAKWTPQMNLMPHNHRMWANIGIYTGREDNIFWRNTENGIKAYDAEALFTKDASALPVDAVHSVTNPLQRFTGGIHVYGGDFFHTARTQWNPETLDAEPSDGAVIRRMFERENERLGLT